MHVWLHMKQHWKATATIHTYSTLEVRGVVVGVVMNSPSGSLHCVTTPYPNRKSHSLSCASGDGVVSPSGHTQTSRNTSLAVAMKRGSQAVVRGTTTACLLRLRPVRGVEPAVRV